MTRLPQPLRNGLLGLLLLATTPLVTEVNAQGTGPGLKPTQIGVLPFNITTSGTYYLTTSLTGVSGQDGIQINASNVNLNLNGHQLRGVPGSRNGIVVNTSGAKSITIQNGTLSNWGSSGIEASVADGMHIDGLVVNGCVNRGMYLGANALVMRTTVSANGGVGILTGNSVALENCLAANNGEYGIFTGSTARLIACTATGNGYDGLLVSGESIVRDSLAVGNLLSGIRAGDNSLVESCNATRNTEHGIVVVHTSRVSNCLASFNGNGQNPSAVGILAEGSSNFIERNQTVQNGVGYRAFGPKNFLSGNTSMSEVGFTLGAGNFAGPIVTSGNLATASNPTSNFDL
jgi:hypothetical protein